MFTKLFNNYVLSTKLHAKDKMLKKTETLLL